MLEIFWLAMMGLYLWAMKDYYEEIKKRNATQKQRFFNVSQARAARRFLT